MKSKLTVLTYDAASGNQIRQVVEIDHAAECCPLDQRLLQIMEAVWGCTDDSVIQGYAHTCPQQICSFPWIYQFSPSNQWYLSNLPAEREVELFYIGVYTRSVLVVVDGEVPAQHPTSPGIQWMDEEE